MVDKKFSQSEIDELRKSLKDLEFSDEEIEAMVEKAEQAEIEKAEKIEDEDEEEVDESDEKEEVDEDEMKKAMDTIKSMKTELDKAMDSFLDRFGKVPGFTTPNFDVKNKSIETDIEKSFHKSFEAQTEVNSEIRKSLDELKGMVEKIAEAPNPLKSLFGDYQRNVIEKGEKFDDEGKQIVSLNNKKAVQDTLLKSLDVVKEADHIQLIRDEISNFTVTNKLNPKTLNIVKKALNVEFEK